jgi:hypothetical protein
VIHNPLLISKSPSCSHIYGIHIGTVISKISDELIVFCRYNGPTDGGIGRKMPAILPVFIECKYIADWLPTSNQSPATAGLLHMTIPSGKANAHFSFKSARLVY